MHVLIISPTQTGIGGIAQHVQGLSSFLKNNDHHVDILSSENTFTLPIKGLKNPSFMLSAFLKTKFKKGNDIVHAHNLPSALPMKHTSGKKILTLHGIYSKQVNVIHGQTTGKISSSYEKDALTWADAITVISSEAYDYYTKLGFKVHRIPNAINISSLSEKSERLYDKQIIFAGRLSKEKGILNLLEAAKKLPSDIHLIILGTGPEQNAVISYIKTQSNVHYLGYQQKNRTIELIRGSALLVQPSLAEGISSTLLESMACKTPIVATRVGGNEEVLENNKTGILVEPDNPQIMMDKILDLLNDDKKTNELREQAFKQVQNYDWSHVGKLYLDIYESLLK